MDRHVLWFLVWGSLQRSSIENDMDSFNVSCNLSVGTEPIEMPLLPYLRRRLPTFVFLPKALHMRIPSEVDAAWVPIGWSLTHFCFL